MPYEVLIGYWWLDTHTPGPGLNVQTVNELLCLMVLAEYK